MVAECFGLGTTEGEDRVARATLHGGETMDARTPKQVGEHSLCLIVCGVPGRSVRAEGVVPGGSCPSLEVRARSHDDSLRSERRTEAFRRVGDHLGFGGRLGT
jgi:hypothetical protein